MLPSYQCGATYAKPRTGTMTRPNQFLKVNDHWLTKSFRRARCVTKRSFSHQFARGRTIAVRRGNRCLPKPASQYTIRDLRQCSLSALDAVHLCGAPARRRLAFPLIVRHWRFVCSQCGARTVNVMLDWCKLTRVGWVDDTWAPRRRHPVPKASSSDRLSARCQPSQSFSCPSCQLFISR
jgi:hypothetical protein